LSVGMDSDVWKSQLSVFVSAKTLIWLFVFVFVFNRDVRWMYPNPIFNIIYIRHYLNYPTKIWHIRHYSYQHKIKYP
jgi:hypothetical protein